MVKRIREPFGKAGLIVAMVALVAAVGGSAIAANTASDSGKRNAKAKKKKAKGVTVAQVRKISKQEAQKFANSNPGPAGPQGPAGANGNDGQNGSNGSDGGQGPQGPAGKSVKVTAAACGGLGGAEVKEEGAGSGVEVCNGEDGENGETGFTETLPSEATETGLWRFIGNGDEYQYVPISFPIPLSTVAAESITFNMVTAAAAPTANCPGTADLPKAEPGYLCVYVSPFETNYNGPEGVYKLPEPGEEEEEGVNTAGALLIWGLGVPAPADKRVSGSFAITAP